MTGSLIGTGRGGAPTRRDLRTHTHALGVADDVAHAVTRPVVDGLESSVCGVLVLARAGEDWPSTGARQCEECTRIAG